MNGEVNFITVRTVEHDTNRITGTKTVFVNPKTFFYARPYTFNNLAAGNQHNRTRNVDLVRMSFACGAGYTEFSVSADEASKILGCSIDETRE